MVGGAVMRTGTTWKPGLEAAEDTSESLARWNCSWSADVWKPGGKKLQADEDHKSKASENMQE